MLSPGLSLTKAALIALSLVTFTSASPVYHLAKRDNPYAARGDVMIQAFYWESVHDHKGGWYDILNDNVPNLQGHFTYAWLPPVSDAAEDDAKDAQGYLPRNWNKLDSQYGTEVSLRRVLKSLAGANIKSMADIVVNHRVGQFNWGDFAEPSFGDNQAAVCYTDEWAHPPPDAKGVVGYPTGGQDTGEPFIGGRDLDHNNPAVQNGVITYLRDRLKGVGFTAWRYDFVRGFAPRFIKQYNDASTPEISFGEFWLDRQPAPDPQTIFKWIQDTGSASGAIDFSTRFLLSSAINRNRYDLLRNGENPAGLIGLAPGYTMTFVDNHDTARKDPKAPSVPFPGDPMVGYAYILTHPGIPCVFWLDYINNLKSQIDPLIEARKAAGVHSLSPVRIDQADSTVYAAYIAGTIGRLAVKIGPGNWVPCDTSFTLVGQGARWAVWRG
ncbi:uncharacterized protein EV422DRAFT_569797 [Fimicolochytrium jonesii]|uniref:uncharacterized protein n=1 Tax=Fimicolochytrium jonesii TaxID=1396493 RepID=UPI0022FED521|nr:uncharacterized protein EV422DRAFT_569797 [Fimicolochytrium jonesii]KAI8818374.1 hypothetical protein EV422DRAFT_569797 [Fimicolochytrium jonesii]